MAWKQLRRYEVQATYAFALSLAAVAPMLGAIAIAWRNYQDDIGQIVYGSRGMFLPLFLGSVLLSMFPGALGFALGWSSAGQRRNDRPSQSWIGFFIGGLVLAVDLILVIAFWMLRLEQPV